LHDTWTADGFELENETAEVILKSKGQDYHTTLRQNTTGFTLEMAGERRLSLSKTQSFFHGEWITTEMITLSDRRLKSNIRSLRSSLRGGSTDDGTGGPKSPSWLLRQLRPVSFQFHSEDAGKQQRARRPAERYGFIAQEVKEVIPQMVRTVNMGDDQEAVHGVAYQDLLALLVSAHQAQQTQLTEVDKSVKVAQLEASSAKREVNVAQLEIQQLNHRMEVLSMQVEQLRQLVLQAMAR